jgi:hypothetical protein
MACAWPGLLNDKRRFSPDLSRVIGEASRSLRLALGSESTCPNGLRVRSICQADPDPGVPLPFKQPRIIDARRRPAAKIPLGSKGLRCREHWALRDETLCLPFITALSFIFVACCRRFTGRQRRCRSVWWFKPRSPRECFRSDAQSVFSIYAVGFRGRCVGRTERDCCLLSNQSVRAIRQ